MAARNAPGPCSGSCSKDVPSSSVGGRGAVGGGSKAQECSGRAAGWGETGGVSGLATQQGGGEGMLEAACWRRLTGGCHMG